MLEWASFLTLCKSLSLITDHRQVLPFISPIHLSNMVHFFSLQTFSLCTSETYLVLLIWPSLIPPTDPGLPEVSLTIICELGNRSPIFPTIYWCYNKFFSQFKFYLGSIKSIFLFILVFCLFVLFVFLFLLNAPFL